MNALHNSLALRRLQRQLFSAAIAIATFVSVCAASSSLALARTQQDEEREFKNTIPAHIPLKIKLKNEQSFKNMKNKHWARELEIEVKNTGDKPIYFLYVNIIMPELLIDGNPVGFQLYYGRKELVRLTEPVQPDDVAIQPGESVFLKMRESQVRGYEERNEEERRPLPKKIEFDLQLINFGDGTGFSGTHGTPRSVVKP